jgi:hypothetical protein
MSLLGFECMLLSCQSHFYYLERKQAQSVAMLGTARFVSDKCGVGLFPRIPARDQFDNGSHPDGDGSWLHGLS